MHKKSDYRTVKERIYDFLYKHKLKIILFSFIASLCIVIVSIITLNIGGLYTIVFYPVALITFIIDLVSKDGCYRYIRFLYPAMLMLFSIILFVWGFFGDV